VNAKMPRSRRETKAAALEPCAGTVLRLQPRYARSRMTNWIERAFSLSYGAPVPAQFVIETTHAAPGTIWHASARPWPVTATCGTDCRTWSTWSTAAGYLSGIGRTLRDDQGCFKVRESQTTLTAYSRFTNSASQGIACHLRST